MILNNYPRDTKVKDLPEQVKAEWLKAKPIIVKFRTRFLSY